MKLSAMKINSKAIREGGWLGEKHGTPIPGFGNLCLKVRGTDSAEYRQLRANKVRDLKPEDRNDDGSLKVAVADRLSAETFDEFILLDWQFLQDEDGSEIPFDPATRRLILMDPDCEPFRDAVTWAAGQVGVYRKKTEDDVVKN